MKTKLAIASSIGVILASLIMLCIVGDGFDTYQKLDLVLSISTLIVVSVILEIKSR